MYCKPLKLYTLGRHSKQLAILHGKNTELLCTALAYLGGGTTCWCRSAASRAGTLLQVLPLHDVSQVRDALFWGRGRGRGGRGDGRPTSQWGEMCWGVVNGLLGWGPLRVKRLQPPHTHTHHIIDKGTNIHE